MLEFKLGCYKEEEDDELFLVLVPALQLAMYDEKEPEK